MQTFVLNNINGSHLWEIGCYDESGNYGVSEDRVLVVIKLTEYNSLNLSSENIDDIENFYLEKESYGKINFTEKRTCFSH